MKKNGFTMIELLVTIGIMALIGVVIATNMLGLFSKQEDKDYEDFKKQIEEAACVYVDVDYPNRDHCRNYGCNITVSDLKGAGYLDDNLKDPSTGELASGGITVKVQWINNEKTCKINS